MIIENISISRAAEVYRDYLNNFLTVEKFAEYYGISTGQAEKLILIGRFIHNQGF